MLKGSANTCVRVNLECVRVPPLVTFRLHQPERREGTRLAGFVLCVSPVRRRCRRHCLVWGNPRHQPRQRPPCLCLCVSACVFDSGKRARFHYWLKLQLGKWQPGQRDPVPGTSLGFGNWAAGTWAGAAGGGDHISYIT